MTCVYGFTSGNKLEKKKKKEKKHFKGCKENWL